jgi:lipopolysaccharide/colanic/teichoic acid biosynthesis glycosyltransferase
LFRSKSAWRFAVKRVFDVIASVALLVLFSVPMCLTALVVLLEDGSPVLFRQTRPGMNARLFTMYKFRTMGDASGPDGRPLPDVQRLTRAGRVLRTYSLDELPQLVNVLKGQMSLVGPRPLRVSYLPFYTERERIRFAVRPGMTGLAQVMGRNNLPWCDRLALDTQYVEKWSLALDLRILWQTAGRVIAHKGVQVIPGLALQPLDMERAGVAHPTTR